MQFRMSGVTNGSINVNAFKMPKYGKAFSGTLPMKKCKLVAVCLTG